MPEHEYLYNQYIFRWAIQWMKISMPKEKILQIPFPFSLSSLWIPFPFLRFYTWLYYDCTFFSSRFFIIIKSKCLFIQNIVLFGKNDKSVSISNWLSDTKNKTFCVNFDEYPVIFVTLDNFSKNLTKKFNNFLLKRLHFYLILCKMYI